MSTDILEINGDHFITTAGSNTGTGIYWWCSCSAEGYVLATEGFSAAGRAADAHMSSIEEGN